ncbi:hypothetical protein ABZV93_10330 [Actinopolymorpha sp. NPDC004070]
MTRTPVDESFLGELLDPGYQVTPFAPRDEHGCGGAVPANPPGFRS